MKRYFWKFLLVLTLLLIFAVPAAAADYTSETVEVTIDGYQGYDEIQKVLKYVNQYRAEVGAKPVVLDKELTRLAMQRAAELAVFYGHERPNGKGCFTVFEESAASFVQGSIGENIAQGYGNAADVSQGWYNSPGHYNNMVKDSHVSVGIGCFYQKPGNLFWVQLFSGGSSGEVCTASAKKAVTATVQAKTSRIEPQAYPQDQEGNLLLIAGKTRQVPLFLKYSITLGDCYKLSSANSSVVKASGRNLTGVAAGKTEVDIVFSGLRCTIPVRVYAPLKLTYTVNNGTAVTTWEDPTGVAKLFYRKVGESGWHQPYRSDNQYWQYINEGEAYEVVLRVRCDSDYIDVSNVLTITRKGMQPAMITAQPKTAYTKLGQKATVTVKAKGDGLQYQWYIKNAGGSKYSKSSVTGPTYTCTMSAKSKDRRVLCIITDVYGNSVQSKSVVLREAVSVTQVPKNAYVKKGSTAKAALKASGDGLTYQWYIKNPGSTKYSKSSITSPTYSCTMSDKSKDRYVYCVITDKYGNTERTKTVVLRMAATITTQPKSVAFSKGNTAKIPLKAAGDGLTYQWYIKNPGSTKYSKSSVTSPTYSCTMRAKADGRRIYCVVTDKYGKTAKSNTVTLSMK